jgi:hypothetical protein
MVYIVSLPCVRALFFVVRLQRFDGPWNPKFVFAPLLKRECAWKPFLCAVKMHNGVSFSLNVLLFGYAHSEVFFPSTSKMYYKAKILAVTNVELLTHIWKWIHGTDMYVWSKRDIPMLAYIRRVPNQGDQIGRILYQRAIAYLFVVGFSKITEVVQILGYFSNEC